MLLSVTYVTETLLNCITRVMSSVEYRFLHATVTLVNAEIAGEYVT